MVAMKNQFSQPNIYKMPFMFAAEITTLLQRISQTSGINLL